MSTWNCDLALLSPYHSIICGYGGISPFFLDSMTYIQLKKFGIVYLLEVSY